LLYLTYLLDMTTSIYAEIIAIGDEVLFGQTLNTNAHFISNELQKIGVKVTRHTVIGDKQEEILYALSEAEERSDLILITGGLGPTKDDITKKTLCIFFDSDLIINEDVLNHLTGFMQKRGRELTETNRQQAMVPEKCQVLFNVIGTAPGMWFKYHKKVIISMPGVPREMQYLMDNEVIPKLKSQFKMPFIYHKIIRTYGAGESTLSDTIESWELGLPENIKLAYLPTYGEVKLRLTATGQDLEVIKQQVDAEVQKVVPMIQPHIFGYDDEELVEVVGKLLVEQGKTISTAESCTGGFIAHLITQAAGSSRYYQGGIVSYSNEIKTEQLGVNPETLMQYGAVSEETIKEMAENVRLRYKTDIGVASSGVAGPDGGSPEKPVGTVWIAFADGKETYTRKLSLFPDRLMNIQFASYSVMDMVRRKLQGWL
jgi:nicotinamide-nucleotide amidase